MRSLNCNSRFLCAVLENGSNLPCGIHFHNCYRVLLLPVKFQGYCLESPVSPVFQETLASSGAQLSSFSLFKCGFCQLVFKSTISSCYLCYRFWQQSGNKLLVSLYRSPLGFSCWISSLCLGIGSLIKTLEILSILVHGLSSLLMVFVKESTCIASVHTGMKRLDL